MYEIKRDINTPSTYKRATASVCVCVKVHLDYDLKDRCSFME